MSEKKPTYCCLSHLWGMLTKKQYDEACVMDEMNELGVTEIRQALCDILQVYIDYTELFNDSTNEWNEWFGHDQCWDLALESFYNECVDEHFNIFENNFNVDIKNWKYYSRKIEMRGEPERKTVEQLNDEKREENAQRLVMSDKMKEIPIATVGSTMADFGHLLSPEDERIIFATLDMAETDAHLQLNTNIEARFSNSRVTITGVRECVEDSLFIELLRAKIALTGSVKYEDVEYTGMESLTEDVIGDYYYIARIEQEN